MAPSTGSLPPLRRSAPERDAAANPSHGVRQGRRRNYRAAAAHPCAHPGPGCAHTTLMLKLCLLTGTMSRIPFPVLLLSTRYRSSSSVPAGASSAGSTFSRKVIPHDIIAKLGLTIYSEGLHDMPI
ncbi:uncharacterized protein [Lolium perenne]|uniref:uncharacterized protein isoform X4 n=1 Tax=Lolium perenne TaxID=4522 RepID=UPI003A99A4EA